MSAAFAVVSAIAVALMLALWIWHCAPTGRSRWLGLFGLLIIMGVTAAVGQSGILADFSPMPPPLILFLGGLLLAAIVIVASPWGAGMCDGTPLRVLIAMQAFRILPEWLLVTAWRDGLAPVQMTLHGRNFDLLTALAALALSLFWLRLRRRRTWAWGFSLFGLALLSNILVIALLSAPTPLRYFMNEPANTFVTTFPFIWLPGVHVLTALVLHGLTVRKLLRQAQLDF